MHGGTIVGREPGRRRARGSRVDLPRDPRLVAGTPGRRTGRRGLRGRSATPVGRARAATRQHEETSPSDAPAGESGTGTARAITHHHPAAHRPPPARTSHHDDDHAPIQRPVRATQRHDRRPTDPPASAAPASGDDRCARHRAGWTDSDAHAAGERYTPAPEPRPDWARDREDRSAADRPSAGTSRRPRPRRSRRAVAHAPRTGRCGSLVGAALLSAVLASGGTVLALGAAGALDRTAPPSPVTAQGTNVGAAQPVTIDESSATIDVAAKVSPAVVRITVTGSHDAGDLGVIPETGVGSGVIYDSDGWILTNRHVVEGGDEFDVELKDGRVLRARSTASTR